MKNTPQRNQIIKALKNNRSHPDAEKIYKKVKKTIPYISLSTVYNNLETMAEKGEILLITADQEKKRFDPFTKQHDHIFCVKCEKVFDSPARLKKIKVKNFKVLSFALNIKAICPNCAKKERK